MAAITGSREDIGASGKSFPADVLGQSKDTPTWLTEPFLGTLSQLKGLAPAPHLCWVPLGGRSSLIDESIHIHGADQGSADPLPGPVLSALQSPTQSPLFTPTSPHPPSHPSPPPGAIAPHPRTKKEPRCTGYSAALRSLFSFTGPLPWASAPYRRSPGWCRDSGTG